MSNPFYNGIEFRWEEHKRFWNWLSENPVANEIDWPEFNFLSREDKFGICFNCGYERSFNKKDAPNQCPLSKNCNGTIDYCFGGLYEKWFNSKNLITRSELAKQIANLPLRNDWDWETLTGEPYGSR